MMNGEFLFPLISQINGKIKIIWQQVIAAIIIGIIAGVFSGYIAVSKIEVKIEYLKEQIIVNKARIDKIDDRVLNIIEQQGLMIRELQRNKR